MPDFKFPDKGGLSYGDPITSEGKLLGHVDSRGKVITLVCDGEEMRVPLLFDGPYLNELMAKKLPDDTPIPIKIGGYASNINLTADGSKRKIGPDPISTAIDSLFERNRRKDDPTLDRLLASKEQIEARGEILQRQRDRAVAESERGQLLLQAARNVIEDLKGRKPANMKEWADLVNTEAHKMGYVGRAFTEAEASFQRDVAAATHDKPDQQERFRAASSFRRDLFNGEECDFCATPAVAWDYPCDDFELDAPGDQPYHSDGAWAACDLCAQAVERNDRLTLANRYLKTKPAEFRETLRPWTIRLHNQFFRHRSGNRQRHPDYSAMRDDSPEARAENGGISVMSADNTEAARAMGMEAVAEQVKQTGEAAMVVLGDDGTPHVVASGDAAVDATIERRSIINRYLGHPLMDRYFHHMHSMNAAQGLWKNSEAWHALAEKYVVTLGMANSLGIPGKENDLGSFYFDPKLNAAWGDKVATYGAAMGLYLSRAMHSSVPYLWMHNVDELAETPDLPPHHVTRGLVPHPAMFWSFEAAMGPPEARIDWMLILESSRGYEVWSPIADDVSRSGIVMLTGAMVPYGAKWPDDLGGNTPYGLAEFLLKRLSFLNSKYVETPRIRAHRSVRRDVERSLKKQHQPIPDDDLGAYVIHLRAPEPRHVKPSEGEMREFERKHCWWRRAHTRILGRNTPRERATWVRAALCGDTNLPLIRTTIVVDR